MNPLCADLISLVDGDLMYIRGGFLEPDPDDVARLERAARDSSAP